jgi:hypothetical protein
VSKKEISHAKEARSSAQLAVKPFPERWRAAPNSLIEEEVALDVLGTVDDRQDVGEAAESTLALG